MRIGLLIGGFGRGGSERQLSVLASGLAERGHAVEVVAYGGSRPHDDYLNSPDVSVRMLDGVSRASKLRAVRGWIRDFDPHVIHGFMKRASMVAVLASLPQRRSKVVASDFSTATYSRRKPILWLALVFFSLADRVATQTETNRRSLALLAPWLKRKTVVVRNGVNTKRFTPRDSAGKSEIFRFVCVGTVYRVKNPLRVVEAAGALKHSTNKPFVVDWFGRLGLQGDKEPSREYFQSVEATRRLGLEGVVVFHGENAQIEQAYRSADVVLHPSVQEGIPNAVVEGMASGLPIIVSKVSDLPLIVAEGDNGIVCDERDPASIARAMKTMLDLEPIERRQMGLRSRALAERWFGLERFVAEYEALYRELVEDVRLNSK